MVYKLLAIAIGFPVYLDLSSVPSGLRCLHFSPNGCPIISALEVFAQIICIMLLYLMALAYITM